MNYESSSIIDSNGQKYRVGWDEHGWFSIESGELWTMDEMQRSGISPEEYGEPVEYDDEARVWVSDDHPVQSFTPAGVEALIEEAQNR